MIPQLHHRRSVRLNGYDYAQSGAYFVTICTNKRQFLFGQVINEKMSLNEMGQIVTECWDQIPQHFPHVEVDEFVVMPNHVHGIIVIVDDRTNGDDQMNGDERTNGDKRRGTACRAPTDTTANVNQEQFAHPISGSLATIVRSYKSAVTKQVNLIRQTPSAQVWQRNYYEQIIRSEKHLFQVRQYIEDNPLQWALDVENPSYDRRPAY